MKKTLIFFTITILISFPLSSVAYASFIDFEDLNYEYAPHLLPSSNGYEGYGKIPNEYGGLSWDSNSFWMTKDYMPNSGYQLGTIDNVSMFNGWGRDVSMSLNSDGYFSSIEMYLTMARDTSEVIVEGWENNILLYTNSITVYSDKKTFFDFNIPEGIDTFKLRPDDSQMVIDNINYNTTPIKIPNTLFLLGSVLFTTIALKKRTK